MKQSDYAAGFDPGIAGTRIRQKGISEKVVRYISAKNGEPADILKFRLGALATWHKMDEPHWAAFDYDPIDYDDIYFFAEPKKAKLTKEIKEAYRRLNVPIEEQKIMAGTAVDAVIDSRSVATTYNKQLAALGIIFTSISKAIREHPALVKKYFATVVPPTDNFFAALNSAAFSDGTFIYVPKDTKCPIELSSYFRLQSEKLGQFERTLIIADEGAELTYLEGCSAPIRDSYQIHSGIVEVVALPRSRINYATVQNWYGGDKQGRGGVINFVNKRAHVHTGATMSWVQMEVGSIMTWKYPSCVLLGDNSRGEFHSLAITRNKQAADTGTKMIHIGKNTKSVIVSKSVSRDRSLNAYRGLVKIAPSAIGAKNFTKCDGIVIGERSKTLALPTIDNANETASVEHEASVAGISDESLFYLRSRGITPGGAQSLIINGFAGDIVKRLPHEFRIEARELINLSTED